MSSVYVEPPLCLKVKVSPLYSEEASNLFVSFLYILLYYLLMFLKMIALFYLLNNLHQKFFVSMISKPISFYFSKHQIFFNCCLIINLTSVSVVDVIPFLYAYLGIQVQLVSILPLLILIFAQILFS